MQQIIKEVTYDTQTCTIVGTLPLNEPEPDVSICITPDGYWFLMSLYVDPETNLAHEGVFDIEPLLNCTEALAWVKNNRVQNKRKVIQRILEIKETTKCTL